MVRPIAPSFRVVDSANPDEIRSVVHLSGLSTDEKPIDTNFATGSDFVEVNTGKVFMYDETTDGGKWWPFGGDE